MINYEQLRAAVDTKLSMDPEFRTIMKRINSGRATFIDTARYSQVLSHILGSEVSKMILNVDDREAVVSHLLHDSYEDINDVFGRVQSDIDKKKGLNIKPRQGEYPGERVEQFVHSLVDPTVEDSVIERRARAGTETITKSFHDDCIEENAKLHEEAGLKTYIIRMGTDCCQWCSDVAGKYEMKDQPQGIFRRHDNCDCTVIYDGQVLRGQAGDNGKRSKKWVEVPKDAGAAAPTRFTSKQAAEIQARNMPMKLEHEQNYYISPKKESNVYSVNRELVNSKKYHDKFEKITSSKLTNEALYQQSKRLLEMRDGSENEGLIILDARTGKVIVDNLNDKSAKFRTGLSEKEYELIKQHTGKIIMLHNHPDGTRPSGRDILTYWSERKASASVVVGHDGSLYILSNINRNIPLDKIYNDEYNKYIEAAAPKSYAKIKAAESLYETGSFNITER